MIPRPHPDARLVADLWQCGDDYCACSQPVVEWRWTEPGFTGRPMHRAKRAWEGLFCAVDVEQDSPRQAAELLEAVASFRAEGLEVDTSMVDEWLADVTAT